MSADNKPTCKNCRFFKPLDVEDDDFDGRGFCRRHAPRPWVSAPGHDGVDEFSYAEFPLTQGYEFCGDHQPAEPEPLVFQQAKPDQPEALKLLAWCIAQFDGTSGAGLNHWIQSPEYRRACELIGQELPSHDEGDEEADEQPVSVPYKLPRIQAAASDRYHSVWRDELSGLWVVDRCDEHGNSNTVRIFAEEALAREFASELSAKTGLPVEND